MKSLPLCCLLLAVAGCHTGAPRPSPYTDPPEVAFQKLSEAYTEGFLNWRPQQGTALGFHEYDGRINEHTRLAIECRGN